MKVAFQKDEALLNDIQRADPDRLNVWWLGQSGFLVAWGGKRVLFDPYLSDSLTAKYATTDKPHVRVTERVVDPRRLPVDIVTSSHNHSDHLDRETLLGLREANPELAFIAPEANRDFIAERLGSDPAWPIGSNDGVSTTIDGLRFHGLPSAHDALKTNARGEHHFMGFILEIGPWTLYHSGDTRLYDGLVARLRRFEIDLAFLPINGFKPERRVAGNLNSQEAAQLAADCGLRRVVPHHYDMFEFNTADPGEFANEADTRGVTYSILQNGERLTL
jgi:L-ascorbate metabolism protein UlaG (beta-lactamase superfamily)